MTEVEELASFVARASYESLSARAVDQLKIRILDALGCALGAIDGKPVRLVRKQIDDFGGNGHCTLIGGGKTSPDRAAFYNSTLVRYLDFNDSYLAKGETCHPSDNLGAVLAAAEYARRGGRDFLAALAAAYQVQCRLSDVAPVRAKGFDHTTQGAYALAAGVSRALGLDAERSANAIAMCGAAYNALRVTRTGALSHWKGLAYPNTALGCTHAVFLAMRGITGPLGVFEGNKGFKDAISGPFTLAWDEEDLERVNLTILKKFNAEVHSQSVLEGILELKDRYAFSAGDVERIEIAVFDVAYNIIGGGEEGDKTVVATKEQADHSLQYMVAAALLDGQVMPEQYEPGRIPREDVQSLLRKIVVKPDEALTARFPREMPCRLEVRLRDGTLFGLEKEAYEGFHTNPMTWDGAVRKFERLSSPRLDESRRRAIVDCVASMESHGVEDLTGLLT